VRKAQEAVRKTEAERSAALEAADQARKAAEATKVSLAKAAAEPPTKGTGAPKAAHEQVPRKPTRRVAGEGSQRAGAAARANCHFGITRSGSNASVGTGMVCD
jgi:membrane protein involved in colicin uptake